MRRDTMPHVADSPSDLLTRWQTLRQDRDALCVELVELKRKEAATYKRFCDMTHAARRHMERADAMEAALREIAKGKLSVGSECMWCGRTVGTHAKDCAAIIAIHALAAPVSP